MRPTTPSAFEVDGKRNAQGKYILPDHVVFLGDAALLPDVWQKQPKSRQPANLDAATQAAKTGSVSGLHDGDSQ